jgi:hypothetical protein
MFEIQIAELSGNNLEKKIFAELAMHLRGGWRCEAGGPRAKLFARLFARLKMHQDFEYVLEFKHFYYCAHKQTFYTGVFSHRPPAPAEIIK